MPINAGKFGQKELLSRNIMSQNCYGIGRELKA